MANVAIDPLQHNVSIVDSKGRPTPAFLRQWQLLIRELAEAKSRLAALEGEQQT